MNLRLSLAATGSRVRPESHAVFVCQDLWPEAVGSLGEMLGQALSPLAGRQHIDLKPGSLTAVYHQDQTIWLIGLGSTQSLTAATVQVAGAVARRAADAADVRSTRLHIQRGDGRSIPLAKIGRWLGDGLVIGDFQFNDMRGSASPDNKAKQSLRLMMEAGLRSGVEQALTTGRGVQTAMWLGAMPPNVAGPGFVACTCESMANEVGLTFREVGESEARRLNMGGLLAVGQAGSQPPRLLILEHRIAPGRRGSMKTVKPGCQPLLLVGKGVTFDTGGYSLKPSSSMVGMKYDMCGAAAVIGAMEAIARLGVDFPVAAVVPCAENLIDQSAYRVDDIIHFSNGVTCEITNTDAEGRLILADALAYGTQMYQPRAVVDLATLTGGVRVVLGDTLAGLFVNDHELHRQLDIASEQAGEPMWRLPLLDEHRQMMRGTHADLRNSGERLASASQGAAFLSYFVGKQGPTAMPELPWAHLDIASTATADKTRGPFVKGPTGYGVRLLAELAQSMAKTAKQP